MELIVASSSPADSKVISYTATPIRGMRSCQSSRDDLRCGDDTCGRLETDSLDSVVRLPTVKVATEMRLCDMNTRQMPMSKDELPAPLASSPRKPRQ